MDLGIDTQEDRERLALLLATVRAMEDLCDQLPSDPAELSRPGNDLDRLLNQLPEPQVDLRLTIMMGIRVVRGSLNLVRTIFEKNSPAIMPEMLPVILRPALLAGGRILYMLGPQDENQRVTNAKTVLQLEAESYRRAYLQFSDFEVLRALAPQAETVAIYEGRRPHLKDGGTNLPGEGRVLDSVSVVVGELIASQKPAAIDWVAADQGVDDPASLAKEHIRWLFHTYSGIAHGYAWPRLVPGTRSLPGHFIADLTMIVNIGFLAADMTLRRTVAGTPN